jgi:hypothetical protein
MSWRNTLSLLRLTPYVLATRFEPPQLASGATFKLRDEGGGPERAAGAFSIAQGGDGDQIGLASIGSAKRPARSMSGATCTNPSSRPERCAHALDHAQSCACAEHLAIQPRRFPQFMSFARDGNPFFHTIFICNFKWSRLASAQRSFQAGFAGGAHAEEHRRISPALRLEFRWPWSKGQGNGRRHCAAIQAYRLPILFVPPWCFGTSESNAISPHVRPEFWRSRQRLVYQLRRHACT